MEIRTVALTLNEISELRSFIEECVCDSLDNMSDPFPTVRTLVHIYDKITVAHGGYSEEEE